MKRRIITIDECMSMTEQELKKIGDDIQFDTK